MESSPAFWECTPPMGFTYHKARGKIYHEPNLHKSLALGVGGILRLLLNSVREIMPA